MTKRFACRYTRALVLSPLLQLLVTGCYSYVPTAVASAPLVTDVRANLSEPARARLWAVVAPERGYLDGRLIRNDADTLVLEVSIQGGDGQETFLQRIPVARDEVISLQTRQLSRSRTTLLGGVVTVLTTTLLLKILTGKAGGGAYPPIDDGQTESIIPAHLRAHQ